MGEDLRQLALAALMLTAACNPSPNSGLETIEAYDGHAVFLDLSSIKHRDQSIDLRTIWGPQDARERAHQGEMRIALELNCRTSEVRVTNLGFFVEGQLSIPSKQPRPVSGHVPSAGYIRRLFDRLC